MAVLLLLLDCGGKSRHAAALQFSGIALALLDSGCGQLQNCLCCLEQRRAAVAVGALTTDHHIAQAFV
jgi:hypothetical protein